MDTGDAVIIVLLSFGILRWLSRFLDLGNRFPAWYTLLLRLRVPALIILGAYIIFDLELSKGWFWLITGGLVLNTIRLSWAYRPARTILLATVPFLVSILTKDLIRAIAPDFAKVNRESLSSAIGFSALWLITFLSIAIWQKKNLIREQLERDAQEARNQEIEAENSQLEQQVALRTAELTRQKEALLQTVADLKATQEQLVQKEKMASLGELTAGIAHEIQNPLNFVNNFAEVSVELIDELGDELRAGRTHDVQALMDDIRQNLTKINHHGHRADAIVKAMLQHSRSSSGDRQPTDINALADEFLRLSYHGLRAKDSTFNATLLTDFDPAVGCLTIVSQEMGRVLLNLFNNAFYAISDRKKQLESSDYKPTIRVSTQKLADVVEIRVNDNGGGIPQAVLDKIYQPFFTTKPTGEGTGLGLSLSYDIVTKGHKGTLRVDTKEGEFTEFIIGLPYS